MEIHINNATPAPIDAIGNTLDIGSYFVARPGSAQWEKKYKVQEWGHGPCYPYGDRGHGGAVNSKANTRGFSLNDF